ncbi:hypothetical protein [Phenylobacterium sp.]|uniref:hypothetical protein n=1 Tax=Phenylobacterium sp. TaxID=1871053 RepID=UPI00272F85CA|nr:hypothetical protein [Phenylobacterium sp.]MDP1616248.1 hypothetical protein [Phenylobacterium sp.]MDP1988508.1 hypothetical protein [Phenylobacterium sp.]
MPAAVLSAVPAGSEPDLFIAQLEQARAQIETRFAGAGEQLAQSLEVVSSLIGGLDTLRQALSSDSVSRTTEDLQQTAEALNGLPVVQAERLNQLDQLQQASGLLRSHVDDMRQLLRYLRVFALNVKITASTTTNSWQEFAGFAEAMCDQIDMGGGLLKDFAATLDILTAQLGGALEFEHELTAQYHTLLPAVPHRLATNASAIGVHHAKIAEVAASVTAVARDIQNKVAGALIALQIGDITRQRIEHVQFGLGVLRDLDAGGLSADARDRLERRLLHMLADQAADTAADFQAEAQKVAQNLAGLANDTDKITVFHALMNAGGDGEGLRDLEVSVSQARGLVGDVQAATANASKIASDTVETIAILEQRVDVIHLVKRDIQQMAINSSLRCGRLGEIGKPLNVIALELTNHAGHLEDAADRTLKSLDALAGVAAGMEPNGADEGGGDAMAARLDGAAGQLRAAADIVERDLAGMSQQSELAARSLGAAADHLGRQGALGDAVQATAAALAEAAGPSVEDIDDIHDQVAAAMATISARYTMARERTIHALHAPQAMEGALADAPPPVNDDALLEAAFF